MIRKKQLVKIALSTSLAASSAFAAPIKNIQSALTSEQVQGGIESLLGMPYVQPATNGNDPTIAYYLTFPFSSFLDLNKADSNKVELTTAAIQDPNAIVMANYISLKKGDQGSDLGLRLILANEGNRASVSNQLAESNLVQTGDIIVSTRPKFAQSLRYLTLQLLSTHISTAVVVNEGGKKVVYNIDMPMDGDMLGGQAGFGKSKFDSPHFTGESDNLSLHVLRPRLTAQQKQNMQGWLELALRQAQNKTIYPSKISFNTNYESPMYRDPSDLTFIGDTGRLMLTGDKAKTTQHLQMYCSEFAWTMLSLRNCNPTTDAAAFSKDQPSCITPFFNPMQMFGSAFSSGDANSQDLYGMTDGVMILAKATSKDNSFISQLIDQAVPKEGDIKSSAPGLSNGHRDVANMMKPLIDQANSYFNQAVLSGQGQMIDGFRSQLNPNSMRNYSPTAFVVHGMMPSNLHGQAVQQKALDYVATIKYIPSGVNNTQVQKLRGANGI